MNKKEEIFTIGDKTNNGTISKFEIDSNGIRVFFEEKPKNYHVSLNTINHVKQPILTTEDGVDIYKGDTVYCFNNDYSITEFHNIQWKLARRIFSTKEAAEEYINLNKPCLSISDIYNYFNGRWSECSNISRLKELVKSKL